MQRLTSTLCTLTLFLALATCAADQTASAAPPQGAKIEIGDWTNRASGTHQLIEGVLRNLGSETAAHVRVVVKALDATERLVSVHTIFADPSLLAPGEKGTFSQMIPDSDEIVYFSLAADWVNAVQATTPPPSAPAAHQTETATGLSDDEKMHRYCASRWGDDYRMQLYCRKQQIEAAQRMVARLKQHGVLQPEGGMRTHEQTPAVRVFLACYKRWEIAQFDIVDFTMVDYCLKEQFGAMQQLSQ